MRKKKPDPQAEVTCAYCGSKTELFVSTYPDYLNFCRIQTPGEEPVKDCMTDYYQSKKKKVVKTEEVKLHDRTSAIKKLDDLKLFLKNKKHPTSPISPSKNDSKI
jgi:hypothetical protein